jgi:hypothetical protein
MVEVLRTAFKMPRTELEADVETPNMNFKKILRYAGDL